MAIAVEISRGEMHEFLTAQGFVEISLQGTRERVFAKIVDPAKGREISLRVYTTIEGESSRGNGEDAIRTVLVTRVDGLIKIVGSDKRVHRVAGWKANLQSRIDRWQEQIGPSCPKCSRATVRRKSKRGPFWGCCNYPVCRSITPINGDSARVSCRGEASSIKVAEQFFDERGDDSDERELVANGVVPDADPCPW
jgi:hypothetical protein